MRANFQGLSTLEEDFKALGLIGEGKSEGTAAVAEGAEGTEGGEAAESEQLDERRRLQRHGKGYKAVTVHRQNSKVKREKKRYARSAKGRRTAMRRERRQSHGKGMMMKQKWAAKLAQKHGESLDLHGVKNSSLVFMRKATDVLQGIKQESKAPRTESFFRRKATYGTGNEIAAMLEDISRLTKGLVESEGQDVVKAFANIALVADMLKERFEGLSEVMAEVAMDEEMARIARVLGALSEDAARIAKGLNEGISDESLALDVAAVSEAFKTQMDLLLSGLDVYAYFSEGKAEDAEDGDEGEDEDDAEGDDEDESDDEESDEDAEDEDDDESDEEDDEEDEDEGEE